MSGLWLAGMRMQDVADGRAAGAQARQASQGVAQHQAQIKELTHQVERLSLLNQAMWELLRDKLGLTDADLERVANEVDMRDGVADGKMTKHAVRCPSCGRVCNSKHPKCLYCGQLFEKQLFG